MTEQLSAPLDDFKPREIEILRLMAEGLSNQAIADQLFVTKETVRWYNKQIYIGEENWKSAQHDTQTLEIEAAYAKVYDLF